MKNRGVQDILIACRDNLSGFSAAIETAFPKTEQQLRLIHQIRNSTKYISYKHLKDLIKDLKFIYGGTTLEYQLIVGQLMIFFDDRLEEKSYVSGI